MKIYASPFLNSLSGLLPIVLCYSLASTRVMAHDVLWSSTGGGWRSMSADMGFANLFQQANLFDTDGTAAENRVPSIRSIATTSGSTWFASQFFYSQNFNTAVLNSTPDELYTFVQDWMSAYLNMSIANIPPINGTCPLLPFTVSIKGTSVQNEAINQICAFLVAYKGDWAAFVNDMLQAASTNVYQDTGFVTRSANHANVVAGLQTTDWIAQSTLGATMRVKKTDSADVNDVARYFLGPSSGEGQDVYTTFTPVAYVVESEVNAADGQFVFAGGKGDSSLANSTTATPPISIYKELVAAGGGFNFSDYMNYGLYPNTTDLTIPLTQAFDVAESTAFNKNTPAQMSSPFGGKTPNTVQIAAISSAAAGAYSPLIPSALAQTITHLLDGDQSNFEAIEYLLNQYVYKQPDMYDVSVCSQWPNDCTETDARFVDGYYTDSPGVPQNLALYQRTVPSSTKNLIKIIVTDTNVAPTDNNLTFYDASLLSYWNTTWNQNIEPGAFAWAPLQSTPWPSPQVFEEYIDVSSLGDMVQTIPNTNYTYFLLNGTTVDNPVYRVKAGQYVEILWIRINSPIPTLLIDAVDIGMYQNATAELAKDLAANADLLQVVNNFVGQNENVANRRVLGEGEQRKDVPRSHVRGATKK